MCDPAQGGKTGNRRAAIPPRDYNGCARSGKTDRALSRPAAGRKISSHADGGFPMSIATSSVTGRRKLHFDSLDDILAEVDRLNGGRVQALGNWSPGQVLRHLAMAMDSSIDGFGFQFSLPFRLICKVMKNRFLSKPMPAGFKVPPKGEQGLIPPATDWAEGVRLIHDAVRRLETDPNRAKSPLFGSMSLADWDRMHCRHAELHLSFLTPA
jgi:hypothetical protein